MSSSDDPEKVVQALRKARGTVFSLEGAIKLYEDKYDQFTQYRDGIKRLEDNLGWYIDTEDHIKWVTEHMKLTPEQYPKLFEYLYADREAKKATLIRILKEDGWINSDRMPAQGPFLRRLETTLDGTRWHSLQEDHRYVAKHFAKRIEKHLIDTTYNNDDVESMHKKRREIRSLLIDMQLSGLVVLDDRELKKKWQEILNDPISHSEFASLPPAGRHDYELFMPRALYLELTKAVKDLGDAKDVGEAEEMWLVRALQQGGRGDIRDLREAEAKARELAKLLPNYVPRLSTAYAVDRRVFGSGLIKELHRNFQDQADWGKKDCRKFYEKFVKEVPTTAA